ncbi:MAG: GH92 family glycosyl hydrolase [Chitinophagaceae bacterium]|nr:GH92 family glycosyl hydrolase [Chitinophagaceae bacterium]
MKNVCTLFGILFAFMAQSQEKVSNLQYVDPTIGTVGIVLGPAYPTVHLPNHMIRVFPVRKDHLDDQISYFPLTVTSHRLFSVFSVMPVSNVADSGVWKQRFEYSKEKITPYYYKVSLDESFSQLEFVPGKKAGIYRISSPTKSPVFLRLGIINKTGEITANGKRVITGREEFSGMQAFFYAETDADITGIQSGTTGDKKELVAVFGKHTGTVQFKYAVSYISIEQAKINFEKELAGQGLESLKKKAYEEWDKELSKIQAEGGTLAQKRVFYTALYRCFERMVDINEYGRYFSAYDHKVHSGSAPFYVDSWIYDFTIGLYPLQSIINPARQNDFINSYITMYEQSGWMPCFALVDGDWPAMTANYTAVWMADSWFKGIRDFDIKKAYEGLRKNSLDATVLPWRNGPPTSVLDSFYHKYGYIPGLPPGEKETVKEIQEWEKRQSVSITLENSYCDWAIAQLANAAGYPRDRSLFLKKATNYKKMYRAEKGFMWPKDENGNWIEGINPGLAGREYYTENNAYVFNWHVKHDFTSLFDMMGGVKAAEKKLDELYRTDIGVPKFRFWAVQPDASGLVGQYPIGNEMGFFIPYLYNHTGSPWKTQKRIRSLLDTWFPDNLFGYPGDEDGGGMSAFIVLSMMGFYPVTPGIPVYHIGSPVFDKVTIATGSNKKFVIKAKNNNASNVYIQSATLNGRPFDQSWFTHKTLTNGGELEFTMGDEPNKRWAADSKLLPLTALEKRPEEYMQD